VKRDERERERERENVLRLSIHSLPQRLAKLPVQLMSTAETMPVVAARRVTIVNFILEFCCYGVLGGSV